MTLVELARKLRPYIEKAAVSLDDADALDAVQLFPVWQSDVEYAPGERCRSAGTLYKCQQMHTSQPGWEPENTPALWIAISLDAGTQSQPITAARGMAYEAGKYYTDPEDGKLYLCIRSDVLQYLPHELVDHYFSEV